MGDKTRNTKQRITPHLQVGEHAMHPHTTESMHRCVGSEAYLVTWVRFQFLGEVQVVQQTASGNVKAVANHDSIGVELIPRNGVQGLTLQNQDAIENPLDELGRILVHLDSLRGRQ